MRRGNLVAAVLAGSWRQVPSSVRTSAEELEEIAPLLLGSGSAGLGWQTIRNSPLRDSPTAFQLQQAYRLHTLQAGIHRREIESAITFLRAEGLEPLMGKGWVAARSYHKEGLRPYGDIDLYLPHDHYPLAVAALSRPEAPPCTVDLHSGSAELDDRSFDVLYERSRLARIADVDVRVLGPEDHLRLLCLHTLRHGAWRPLWLCDIAVALESQPVDFDWDYFLSGDRRRSDWVACTIGLAHNILAADVNNVPAGIRYKDLPHWLVPTVLRQWGAGQTPHGCRTGMENYLRHPSGLLKALRIRWPNPIEATVGMRGPFNELPRLPFQIGDALFRTAKFLTRVPRSARRR